MGVTSILNDAPFIPDETDRAAAGPLAAAGLPNIAQMYMSMPHSSVGMGASGGPSVPAAPSPDMSQSQPPVGGLSGQGNTQPPGIAARQGMLNNGLFTRPFSNDDARDIATDMRARIRSPEQIQQAIDARKGALQQLQDAYSKPMTSLSPVQLFAMGQTNVPFGANMQMMTQAGLNFAHQNAYQNDVLQRQAGIDAANAALAQQDKEEELANKREDNANTNLSRMMQAQIRGMGTGINSIMSQFGLVKSGKDVLRIDPNTGDLTPAHLNGEAFDKAWLNAGKMAAAQINKNNYPATDEGMAQYQQDLNNAQSEIAKGLIAGLNGVRAQSNAAGNYPAARTDAQVGEPAQSAQGGGGAAPQGQSKLNVSPDILGNNPLMEQYAKDPLHVAVALTESNMNPNAIGPQTKLGHAKGIMQVTDATAMFPGMGIQGVQNLNDMADRERVGHQYLDALRQQFGDDRLALAAYNWGPGNVSRWLNQGADPAKMPAETRNYITKAMGYMGSLSGAAQAPAASPTNASTAAQSPATANQPLPPGGMKATGALPTDAATVGNAAAAPQGQQAPAAQAAATQSPSATPQQGKALLPTSNTLPTPDIWAAAYANALTPKRMGPMDKGNLANIDKQNGATMERMQQDAYNANKMNQNLETISAIQQNHGWQPSWGAAQKSEIANFLTSVLHVSDGVMKDFIDHGAATQEVQGALDQAINEQVGKFGGKTTTEDLAQQGKSLPMVNEMADPFAFRIAHLQELNNRKQALLDFGAALQNPSFNQTHRGVNIQSAVNNFNQDQMGPLYMALNNQQGKTEALTRSQFLKNYTDTNLASGKIPDTPENRARLGQEAAQQWLQMADQKGWQRNRNVKPY